MKKWIIAIGASGATGFEDIRALLAPMPTRLKAAILLVLHRPWHEKSHLREILSRCAQLPVVIAGQGEKVRSGVIYIGEPGIHLTLLDGTFAFLIDDREGVHGNRTIDLLFKSVARCGNVSTVGVVLSGALDDGSRGLAEIDRTGGYTMVLGLNGLPAPGMPENAAKNCKSVSLIGTAQILATEVIQLINR